MTDKEVTVKLYEIVDNCTGFGTCKVINGRISNYVAEVLKSDVKVHYEGAESIVVAQIETDGRPYKIVQDAGRVYYIIYEGDECEAKFCTSKDKTIKAASLRGLNAQYPDRVVSLITSISK